MLNWICPECGREVPAADPECPACTGAIHQELPLPLVLEQQQELFAELVAAPDVAHAPGVPRSQSCERMPPPEELLPPTEDLVPQSSPAPTEEPRSTEPVTEPPPTADPVPQLAAAPAEEPRPAEPVSDPSPTEEPLPQLAVAPTEEPRPAELVNEPPPPAEPVPQVAAAPPEEPRPAEPVSDPPATEEPLPQLAADPVEEPRSAEPLSEPPPTEELVPQLTAAPVEEPRTLEPVSEPSSTEELVPQLTAAPVEEPRTSEPVSEPSPTEEPVPHLTTAPAEEARAAEPISEPPAKDEPVPQPVAASVEEPRTVEPVSASLPMLVAAPVEEPKIAEPVSDPLPQPPEIDQAHYRSLNSAITALAENILESIPSEPVLRIAESFQAAPSSPLLPPGQPFPEPSPTRPLVLARPNITVRALADRPVLGTPQHLGFAQSGPLLPTELSGLASDTPLVEPLAVRKRQAIPGWLVTPVVVVIAFIAAHIWMQSSGAAGEAKPVAAAPAVAAPLSPGGASAMATSADGWPFARYIEVTGIRVVADLNRHSRLHYIVVNHSAADLSDVALRIGVRSASDVSKTLFRVTAVVPSLGAFASKEITVDLDSQARASEIPEWDLLRVDVQAGPR